jgi:hypothetical protein
MRTVEAMRAIKHALDQADSPNPGKIVEAERPNLPAQLCPQGSETTIR